MTFAAETPIPLGLIPVTAFTFRVKPLSGVPPVRLALHVCAGLQRGLTMALFSVVT